VSDSGFVPLFLFLSNQNQMEIFTMKQQFLNNPEDCEWLRHVHLGGRTDYKFESFVLYGNEDCPEKVDLYLTADPRTTDKPHTINFL
jgi:hypothetical protein